MYQPKTGRKCFCKRGVERDNCPHCEGTGWEIDFQEIRRNTEHRCQCGHSRSVHRPGGNTACEQPRCQCDKFVATVA